MQKLSHLGGGGGVPKISLEREDNPEKGGGWKGGEMDVEMGVYHFFITLQFNCIYSLSLSLSLSLHVCACVRVCVRVRVCVKFPLLHFSFSVF